MLFLTEGLLFPVLGAILDSRMSVHDNTSAYPGYKKRYQNLQVLDGRRTFLSHIFRPYISVHFLRSAL